MSEHVVRYDDSASSPSRYEFFQRSTPAVPMVVTAVFMNPHDWNMLLIETATLPRDLVKVIGERWNAKLIIPSAGRFFEVQSSIDQELGLWRFI